MTVFTRTWNGAYEASPANTQAAAQGAQRIRELKIDIRERMEVDHIYGTGSVDEGAHNFVHLKEQGSAPGGAADYGVMYSKDVSGVTELFYKDSAGTETQITQNGNILGRLVGEIVCTAFTAAPTGYLACNGAAVSRTTYSALFAKIGVFFGSGNGSTTFNIPNLTGKVPMGYGVTYAAAGMTNAIGQSGGASIANLQHTHLLSASGTTSASGITSSVAGPASVQFVGNHTHTVTVNGSTTSDTSSTASNLIQPSLSVAFFIKY